MEPAQVQGPDSSDLFHPTQDEPAVSEDLPSESVFADVGGAELAHIGELQIPRPIPVELIVEIDGFDYIYKLDRREKSS